MPGTKPLTAFLSCFNASYDITVPDEVLREKMVQLNEWLQSLPAADQKKAARDLRELILNAQESVRKKQRVLEETILANRTQMTANAKYGKF